MLLRGEVALWQQEGVTAMRRLTVLSVVAFVAVAVGGLLAAREVAQSSNTVGTSPLMSVAPSDPLFPPLEQWPTFSVEDNGPSTPNGGGPYDPADILWNPGGPPMVCIPCVNLGLTGCSPATMPPGPYDDLDALTYGADFGAYPSEDGYLGFSVDVGSTGQPGTGVNNEVVGCAVAPEPEADEFVTQLDGNNLQYFDGDGFPACANPPAPAIGLVEPGDDLDALGEKDCWEIDGDQDYILDRFAFFSLTPASPTLPMIGVPPTGRPATAADVLTYVGAPGGLPWVYASEEDLGLAPAGDDDVNGLCLADTAMDDYFDPTGAGGFQDYLFYTLEKTSASIPGVVPDAATIMYVPAKGVAVPVDLATALGLLADNTDDVDAMKCVKGLVDISIEDYWITLPDGTEVREGDAGASLTLTVSEWVDLTMTEIKHYFGIDQELSPGAVTSNVWWAVLGAPLGSVNVVFEPEPGDICTYDGTVVDCVAGGPMGDINDLEFQVVLPWCEPVPVVRTVQFHCKEPGDFLVTFQNIETPLGADDIRQENNEGLIDLIIICEEATPTPTPTDTPTVTPTPTDTPTPTNTPTPGLGDTHYQCYDIFPQEPPPVPIAMLETQFGPDLAELGPSAQLCAPAIKNGEGDLLDPHLKCYDIYGTDPDVVVNLETQFGVEENVEVGPARKLCLAAAKEVIFPIQVPPGPLADLYYECFDISATGHDPSAVVSVEDQFGFRPSVDVGLAELLCAPALLEGMGTPDAPHLKCYQVPPYFPGEYWMNLETFFGFEYEVMLGESRWLCTEALKEVVECIDREGDTHCDDPTNDPDDDGCTDAEEVALGDNFDPTAWYDVYDVPVPAKADAAGANGFRNKIVDIGDVLAVLFYAFADNDGPPNANGVDYDSIKGWDGDGDSVNDAVPIHNIEEGLKYDRSPGLGPSGDTGIDPAGAPNGAIDIGDVLATLAQSFVVDCTAP